MQISRTSLMALALCGCGVSTADLRDDPRAQTDPAGLDLESPQPKPTPRIDGGRINDEEIIIPFDAGLPAVDAGRAEEPRDAGRPEEPRDAGRPEEPVDAGRPSECQPSTRRSCSTTCGSTSTQACEDGSWGRCDIPREVCGDGVDNDCDGRVDDRDTDCPPPRRTCEDAEGGGCNGDLGYGDHCAPADNTSGCSASRFNAWCNRRNPATPDIWHNWIRTWVDDRCDGAIAETGTQYSTWFCTSSNNERFECTTPLVLSFDDAPVTFERRSALFAFTPGRPLRSDWPSAVTPWLARDVDKNGRIDDGSELFGSDTWIGRRTAKHGFEALAALDESRDGVVDANDAPFSELLVWRDLDGDKRSSRDELQSLTEAGVVSLATTFTVEPRCDDRGNCERERSRFVTATGKRGSLVDVYLRTRSAEPLLACQ